MKDPHVEKISELLKQSSLGALNSDSVEDTALHLAIITPWKDEDREKFAKYFSLMENGARPSIDPDALEHAAHKGISVNAIIAYNSRLGDKTGDERHDAMTEYLDAYTKRARRR